MKKVVIIILVMALLLVGCGAEKVEGGAEKDGEGNKRFERIYAQDGTIAIYLDTETGVKYLWRSAGYSGGLTRLWEE